jgi:hypothetical protein
MTLIEELDTRPPMKGESLYGYLAQMTGDNHLGRVALIAGDTDRIHGHRPQLATTGWAELPALAVVLGIDVQELELRSYPKLASGPNRRAFFGTSVDQIDLRTKERFFSPAALAEKPFHRALWQLRIPFDIETGEVLVSGCDLCGQTQRWRHSAGVAFCDQCGESLNQTTRRVSDDLMPDLKLAVSLTHTDELKRAASLKLLPNEIAQLGPAMAFELLLRLVPAAEPRCTWTGTERIWRNDPLLIAEGMHGAWQLLKGWPKSLADRISRDIPTTGRRHRDGNQGATIRFLNTRNADHIPQKLREFIAGFHESIDISGPQADRLMNMTITPVEANHALGLGVSRIIALRRQGVFRTIGLARGSAIVPFLEREGVMQVANNINERQDLNGCNERLGLPYYAVEQLCALGYLPLLEHRFFSAHYAKPQTTTTALDNLCNRLEAGRTRALANAISLKSAMHFVGGRLKPWDIVVDAMLRGELPYSLANGSKGLMERVIVRRADLLPHLVNPLTRDGKVTPLSHRIVQGFPFATVMSKRDAAEILNLDTKQGTAFLKSYPATGKAVVPVIDVEAFAQQYIASIELAARLNVSSPSVRSLTKALGIGQTSEAGYLRCDEAQLMGSADQPTSG